jgi:hypothetical protein
MTTTFGRLGSKTGYTLMNAAQTFSKTIVTVDIIPGSTGKPQPKFISADPLNGYRPTLNSRLVSSR